MKAIAIAILAALSAPALAQSGMKDMDMKMEKKVSKGTVYKASGTVKKLDAKSGKVTIAHGPVQSIGWPAMTMTFTVKDRKLLDKVAVDKKVDFEFVQRGKDYVITNINK